MMTRREFADRFRDLDASIGRALEGLNDAAFADLIVRTTTEKVASASIRCIEHWAVDPVTGLHFVLATMADGTYRTFEDLGLGGFRALCDEELGYERANGF